MMKIDLGIKPYIFPMPVLMIATYGENDKIDVMNAAWGNICAENMVSLNISEEHMTAKNIKKNKAFTISIADIDHIKEADFFGIATANKMSDKFERTGMTAIKSKKIHAPIIDEFPLTLECKVIKAQNEIFGFHGVGEIVGVLADEKILDPDGKVNPEKLNAFVFDQFQYGYYKIGEKIGKAWNIGLALKKHWLIMISELIYELILLYSESHISYGTSMMYRNLCKKHGTAHA